MPGSSPAHPSTRFRICLFISGRQLPTGAETQGQLRSGTSGSARPACAVYRRLSTKARGPLLLRRAQFLSPPVPWEEKPPRLCFCGSPRLGLQRSLVLPVICRRWRGVPGHVSSLGAFLLGPRAHHSSFQSRVGVTPPRVRQGLGGDRAVSGPQCFKRLLKFSQSFREGGRGT